MYYSLYSVLVCFVAEVTCEVLEAVDPHQSMIDLSSLDPTVFTSCPDLLNADNYNVLQLQNIVQQAYSVCNNCMPSHFI